jgi:hypothetical protein
LCYRPGMTDEEALHFTIAFALKVKARMPTRTKNGPPLEVGDYTLVAKVIVEQLRLAGYRIGRDRREHGPGVHGRT